MHINTVFSLVKLFSRSASSEMAQHVTGVERVSEGCGHRLLTVGQDLEAGRRGRRGTPCEQDDREARFSGHSCLTPCVQASYMYTRDLKHVPGFPSGLRARNKGSQ